MMGYSLVQKGYILLNIQSRTIFVRRYVEFKEHVFPFKPRRSDFLGQQLRCLENTNVATLAEPEFVSTAVTFFVNDTN